MYSSVTRDIKVSVQPVFLDEQSDPDTHRYVWAYRVVIENHGPKTVQLLNRYWRITDSRGSTQEVRGSGAVSYTHQTLPTSSSVELSVVTAP